MAQKYLVAKMSEAVKAALARVPVSLDTVVQTAATALEFSQFEELSEALLTRCASFLKPHLPTPASCFSLAAQYAETELSAACLKLLGRLSSLQGEEPPSCPAGHPLELRHGHGQHWACDCCDKESIVLGNRYGCTSCDYDRCISCYF